MQADFWVILVHRLSWLSQIFKCVYDFIRNLSACRTFIRSASSFRGRCLYLERVGFAWKENSIILNFLPQIACSETVGLHLLYDRSGLRHQARAKKAIP